MTFVGTLQYISFLGQVAGSVMIPVVLFFAVKALRKYTRG